MIRPHLPALLLFFSCLATGRAFYARLSPFTAISVSVSFTGTLVPVPDNQTYDISMQGPAAVEAAFKPVVAGGTLTVGVNSTTLSPQSISATNFTIRMPSGVLQSLSTDTDASFEASGRVTSRGLLTISSAGSGLTSVSDALCSSAVLRSIGAGTVFLEGEDLQSVQYTATGVGLGYISGVYGQAFVSLTGPTDVYVDAGKDTLQIIGLVAGAGKVYYQKGTCSVRGASLTSPCTPGTFTLP